MLIIFHWNCAVACIFWMKKMAFGPAISYAGEAETCDFHDFGNGFWYANMRFCKAPRKTKAFEHNPIYRSDRKHADLQNPEKTKGIRAFIDQIAI